MKRRDFIKLVSVAGTTSLGSGCFADAEKRTSPKTSDPI